MSHSRYEAYERPTGSGTPILLMLLMVGIGCAFGVFYSIEDKLAAFALLIVGGGGVIGFATGAWKLFSMLAGSAAAYFLAAPTASYLIPFIEQSLAEKVSSPLMGLVLSGIVAGCAVTVILMSVGTLLINRVDALKWLDQSFGLLGGSAQTAGMVAVVLWGILALEPHIRELRNTHMGEDAAQSQNIHARLLDIAGATRKSQLLSYLGKWNPFLEVPQLSSLINQTGRFVRAIQNSDGDPSTLAEVLANDPQVRRVVNRLQSAEDLPEAAAALHSNDVGAVIQRLVDGQYKKK